MHKDVHVSEISSGEDDAGEAQKNIDSTTDLKHFFKDATPISGSNKARRQCVLCE